MLIKPFAILAILSGTALPLAVLGIHSVLDARIPHCNEHLPSSVSLCSDSVTVVLELLERGRALAGRVWTGHVSG